MTNNWSIKVATANGSGSQSANTILVKTLFRMGIPVGAKNLFPSNIQGLPTWFTIRVHPDGFVSRKTKNEIFVAMNPKSLAEDISEVAPGGYLILNKELEKTLPTNGDIRNDIQIISIPFRDLVQNLGSSVKLRKLLINIAYVGVLARLLKLDKEIVQSCIADQFADKTSVYEINLEAFLAGYNYADSELNPKEFPFQAKSIQSGNAGKILIDGNSASAMGLLFGGCSFLSWYPITPSSSLAENFENLCEKYRKTTDDKNNFGIVQAEDELSAINMVIGAGWAGARAATTTSGPGLSLMSEAAGLSYFAEVPAVIWDVQRAGPSTGLPTRTLQGDIISAQKLSHGDTEHVLLIPSNPEECFAFGKTALDLAERLQTLIVVLSDLDLGMNFWISNDFKYDPSELDRGKVMTAAKLNEVDGFARYADVDGDGIPYRTRPGTKHVNAAYFTRGTGHNEKAGYTEDADTFAKLLTRLKNKFTTASKLVPESLIEIDKNADVGLIAYGSTDFIIPEVRQLLKEKGIPTSYFRIKSWPINGNIEAYIQSHKKVFVIEQNRDGQMLQLLKTKYDLPHGRMESILSFDGLPVSPQNTFEKIMNSGLGRD